MPLTKNQAIAVHTGTLIPIVGFLLLYSTMGYGIDVYAELSEPGNYAIAWYLGVVSLAWLAVMFLVDAFDHSLSSPSARRNVTILTSIPCITLFVASLLSVEYYVSAPIVLFVIFVGVCLYHSVVFTPAVLLLYERCFPLVAAGGKAAAGVSLAVTSATAA